MKSRFKELEETLETQAAKAQADLADPNAQLQSTELALCALSEISLYPDVRLVAFDGFEFFMNESTLLQALPGWLGGPLAGGFAEQA